MKGKLGQSPPSVAPPEPVFTATSDSSEEWAR